MFFFLWFSSLTWFADALQADNNVIQSPNDHAVYASFELDNQLRVLVISDPQTDKSAAALAVRVGSSSDPGDRAGLAHFLEHMLFLGTEKYPHPGEYQSFIRRHGGRQNAYTSYEFTTYFFDIEPDYFEPALDRFSQFFVAPSFDPKYVSREVNAVDSEYRSRLKEDGRRRVAAEKAIFNKAHPYSRFLSGNLQTLGHQGLREAVVQFYKTHYSSNLMTLVVLGREPVAQMREWIELKFGAIENRNQSVLTVAEPLIAPGTLPLRLNITPNKDRRSLTLTFPVTPTRSHYLSKPTYLLGALLGDEGEGSLLSVLKTAGWADGLSAGAGLNFDDTATFSIAIALTESGLNHINEIVALVFQQIRNLRRDGIRRWAFEEYKLLAELAFRYQEQASPSDKATDLATRLHIIPVIDVIRAPYAFDVFDPALITELLDELVPQNLLLTVFAQGLYTDRNAEWYETPYAIQAIPTSLVETWRTDTPTPGLSLPKPNPFIPESLELLEAPANAPPVPVVLEQRPGLVLWHKQETEFGAPRADFYLAIRSCAANDTVNRAVLTNMFTQIVNDQLNERTYPARLAGLDYRIHPQTRGLAIKLSGYNDKQTELLDMLLETITGAVIDPQRFEILKERRLRMLRNVTHDRPFTQTNNQIARLLIEPSWAESVQIETLEALTASDLEKFRMQLLEGVSIMALAHGNVSAEDASDLANMAAEKLLDDTQKAGAPAAKVVKLPPAESFVQALVVEHDDSALTQYYQGPAKDFSSRAKMALLNQILSPAFYRELRTEQQVGYIVYVSLATLIEAPGITFVVQSPVADPARLQQLTEAFIDDFAETLQTLSDEIFEEQKHGLITQLAEMDQTLTERTDRYWRELERNHLAFDTQANLIAATKAITLADFITFYDEVLRSPTRRSIAVYSVGQNHTGGFSAAELEAGSQVVTGPAEFRRGKVFFQP